MMTLVYRSLIVGFLVLLAVLVSDGLGEAQTNKTFTFRLQPFCDKITITILSGTQSVLSFAGYNDNCGDPPSPRPAVYGTIVINPDGGFTIGYTTSWPISAYPNRGSDVASQTNVEWPKGSDVGFWKDDDGQSGTFVFDILDQKGG